MLLPDDLITDVHYYHYDTDTAVYIDIITVYFNSWWRFKKVFKFHRYPALDEETGIVFYNISMEASELLMQLQLWVHGEDIDNDVKIEKVSGTNITKLNFSKKYIAGSPPEEINHED